MNNMSVSFAFRAFLALLLLHCATAHTEHVVGGSTGWEVPPNADFYKTWAADKSFVVGDVLTFNFTTNQHDVLRLPKESYDSCSPANAIGNLINAGPTNVTLSDAGEHYFICTIGRHCQNGQKLAINVSASSTPTALSPSSPLSPPTSQGTPPPGSSAPRAFAGFFLVLFSIALGTMVF